jgi:hypothetical protein
MSPSARSVIEVKGVEDRREASRFLQHSGWDVKLICGLESFLENFETHLPFARQNIYIACAKRDRNGQKQGPAAGHDGNTIR